MQFVTTYTPSSPDPLHPVTGMRGGSLSLNSMPSTRYSPAMLELLQLRTQQTKQTAPSFPEQYLPKPKYKQDANGLTAAIIDYIDLRGGWATRISVEGRYVESIGRRIPSSVKRGTADIHACWKGRHLSIEVKIGADRQSDDQRAIQADIEAAGGIYYIARSFDEFHQWFNTL